MIKIKIRYESSYWTGTLADIQKWATETPLNDFMRRRQKAAQLWIQEAAK